MSFPRARIQRFNECPNDAPPPGSYDPKFKGKVKGLISDKVDRFHGSQDGKSVSSSCADYNSSSSSRATSITAIPPFKVPHLPKNKVSLKPSSLQGLRTKKKTTTPNNDVDSKYDTNTELADLKVECLNKDKTISEYEKQIEEMREDIRQLEKQLFSLKEKQSEIERQYQNDIDEMKQDRRLADVEMKTKMQKMQEEFEMEISNMKAQESKLKNELDSLADVHMDLESKLQQRQHLVLQLQSQLSTLQCELDECRDQIQNVHTEEEHRTAMLNEEHAKKTESLLTDFEREKKELLKRLDRQTKEKAEIETRLESEVVEKKCTLEKMTNIQWLYSDVQSRLKEAEDELCEIRDHHAQVLKNHSEEIETLMSRHAEEISRLMQRSEDFRQECSADLQKARDIEVKTDQMMLEAKKSVDEEVEKAVENYAAALMLVETQSKFLRERIHEKDSEIVKLLEMVQELRECSATKESSNQSLQTELDKTEAELAEKKEEVRTLKDQLRNEAAEMVTRRRRLDLIMAGNQATITVLTERLTHSDAEVERLQNELEFEKKRLAEHRDLLATMRTNSTLVREQMLKLLQELDVKREDIDQLVVENLVKFDTMKVSFDAKIKELNEIAATEITRLREDCDKKNNRNAEMKQQLAEMSEKLDNARDMLLKVEEQYDAQCLELAHLQLSHRKLVELYNETNTICDAPNGQSPNQQLPTVEKAPSIPEMTESAAEISNVVENADTTETSKCETDISKLQAERDLLESRLREIETEYKDLADKYAAAMGHTNHKQKIHHMMQMKTEKLQLKEEVEAAKRTIAQQQRIIEKLRSDERSRLHSKEKENLPSPHKPSTPLKDRNV